MQYDNGWYYCGWNDTVYGLQTCRDGAQTVKYIHDMQEAIKEREKHGSVNGYVRGCKAVLDRALETGIIPNQKS